MLAEGDKALVRLFMTACFHDWEHLPGGPWPGLRTPPAARRGQGPPQLLRCSREGGRVLPGRLQPGRGQGLRAPPHCVSACRGTRLLPPAPRSQPDQAWRRVAGYGPCLAATIHLHNAKVGAPGRPAQQLPGLV